MSTAAFFNPIINTSLKIEWRLNYRESSHLSYVVSNLGWTDTDSDGYSTISPQKIADDLGGQSDKKTVYRDLAKLAKMGLIEFIPQGVLSLVKVLEKGAAWLNAKVRTGIISSHSSWRQKSDEIQPDNSAKIAADQETKEAKRIAAKMSSGMESSRHYIYLKRSSIFNIYSTNDMEGLKLPMKGDKALVINLELADALQEFYPTIDVPAALFDFHQEIAIRKTYLRYGTEDSIFKAIESWLARSNRKRRVNDESQGEDPFTYHRELQSPKVPSPPIYLNRDLSTLPADCCLDMTIPW